VLEYAPQLEVTFRNGKKRAVDKFGFIPFFMLTEKWDEAAARRFFNKAI
jgi:hypothetical protein